jgi:hypothetical protein
VGGTASDINPKTDLQVGAPSVQGQQGSSRRLRHAVGGNGARHSL